MINPRLCKGEEAPRGIYKTALRIGFPVFLERASMSSGQIMMTFLITGLGAASIAANSLAVTAESVSYMPASGFAMAATVLVGQAIGAGREKLAGKFGRISLLLGIGCMILSGAALYIFSDKLIALFIDDAEVIALGGQMLRIVAFSEPMFASSIILFGVFRGAGDTKIGFFIGVICMWGVRVITALILVPKFGLAGAWYAMAIDLVLRGILAIVYFSSGRWKKYRAV